MKWHMIFITAFLFLSCANRQAKVESNRPQFFGIARIIDSLPASHSMDVLKTISIDGVLEEKHLTDYNFHRDLEGFENYSINKAALYDKYQVDSIWDANGLLTAVIYTGTQENLKVQKMEVGYEGRSPRSISLELKTDSFLEDVEMDIHWDINTQYHIIKREKRIFGKEHRYEITVTIQS